MKQPVSLAIIILILLAPTIATAKIYGTNESSYQYGFNQAISDYETCYQGWDTEGCNIGSDEPISECYVGAGPGNVTNSTSCTDGYVHGWEHWCEKNTRDCAQLAADDIIPGSLVTDNKTALVSAKALSYIVSTWNFVNSSKEGLSTSGIIIFKGDTDQSFIEIVDGKIVHGDGGLNDSGGWYSDGHMTELSYNGGPGMWMTFTTVTPNHMELIDVKGDIIQLTKIKAIHS